MSELLIMATLVMILNVLDSVTTNLGFRQYPDPTLEGEANPIMRWLMRKNKWLAEFLKQGFVLAIVIFMVMSKDLFTLRLAGILLGLVVLNNSYVVASRSVMGRKLASPINTFVKFFHIPKPITYLAVVIVFVGLAHLINSIIW